MQLTKLRAAPVDLNPVEIATHELLMRVVAPQEAG